VFDRLTITRLQDLPGDGVKPAKIVVVDRRIDSSDLLPLMTCCLT